MRLVQIHTLMNKRVNIGGEIIAGLNDNVEVSES